jgi:hypothetical protein
MNSSLPFFFGGKVLVVSFLVHGMSRCNLFSHTDSFCLDWMEGMVTEYLVATFADYFGDVKM